MHALKHTLTKVIKPPPAFNGGGREPSAMKAICLKRRVKSEARLWCRQEENIPPQSAGSGLFCANSSLFRPSFSDWILCIAPWYSDRVRSTESRISFTVALKIEFREDSRNSFSSLDLSMFFRAAVNCKHLTTGSEKS